MKSILDISWTADRVMKTYPQTIAVFLALKTDCVGCYMERFCTLAEVATAYHLSVEQLIKKLTESIKILNEE